LEIDTGQFQSPLVFQRWTSLASQKCETTAGIHAHIYSARNEKIITADYVWRKFESLDVQISKHPQLSVEPSYPRSAHLQDGRQQGCSLVTDRV
jgi:hypothetical protein